jgi:chromosome partitioning protein
MIISLVNQKGGVGKSTTAINLAASLARKNCKLVFIDTDPQGSAVRWHAIENNKAFEIKHHPRPIYHQDLNELSWDYDHVVIDAPPANGDITQSILAVTDLAIIPLSPSPVDMWSCDNTLEMINKQEKQNTSLKSKLLVCRKIPGTKLGREARETMGVFDTDIFETELCQRVAYIEAMNAGVSVLQYAPNSKAAREVENFSQEIIEQMVPEQQQDESQNDNVEKPSWESTPGLYAYNAMFDAEK